MSLRDVRPEDLDEFFTHQQDEQANVMSVFAPRSPSDRGVFDFHWAALLADPDAQVRTIADEDDRAAGALVCTSEDGAHELSFWVAREHWGRGLTTAAVEEFLAEFPERPVVAHVATDNVGSQKVLARHGFEVTGERRVFSNARAEVVTELVMEHRAQD